MRFLLKCILFFLTFSLSLLAVEDGDNFLNESGRFLEKNRSSLLKNNLPKENTAENEENSSFDKNSSGTLLLHEEKNNFQNLISVLTLEESEHSHSAYCYASLSNLSNEVINHIFSFLSFKTLGQMERLSSRFKEILGYSNLWSLKLKMINVDVTSNAKARCIYYSNDINFYEKFYGNEDIINNLIISYKELNKQKKIYDEALFFSYYNLIFTKRKALANPLYNEIIIEEENILTAFQDECERVEKKIKETHRKLILLKGDKFVIK